MVTETTPGPGLSPTTDDPPLLGEPPGFRPPRGYPSQDPPSESPSPTSSTTTRADDPGTTAGESPSPRPPRSSSSPGSTREEPEPPPADPTELRPLADEIVKLALGMPGVYLNGRRTPGTDVWLLDEQDVEAIADPLARIAARRLPAGGETSDVVDAALAVLGFGGYVMKNLTAERIHRATAGGATIERPRAMQPPSETL